MSRFDIAVIGTGPAGLEAAITAKVRNKNVLLLGSTNLSPKVEKAHTVQNYLGLPQVSGEDMQKAFSRHLESMDIVITQDRINTVYAMGSYFALQGHAGMYEADSVILACGMSAAKPFPGELENLGRGVSYCATCDGALYKGKSALVIGYSAEEEKEADFLAEMADEVIYIPMYSRETSLNEKVRVLSGVNPVSIEKKDKRVILSLKERNIETDGIFILRESVAPSQLVPGLELEKNRVVVDRKQKTNIPGLFACGDITGEPYQYIKAAGEGNVAALSAVSYLAEMKAAQAQK
ncbi:MAG: NAD(P)/FAD-dependent oxidoreductase [Clostridia bacterium]|nr:NAD(P)/FAD-dependent oxidoreductase [Clostridia bacterium]